LAPEPGGGTRPGREHTLRSEQAPTRLELAWQAHGADLPVNATVRITLAGRQARIRQQLHFLFPREQRAKPRQVLLRLPEALADRLQVEGDSNGLKRSFDERGKPSTFWASLNAEAGETPGQKDSVTLLYSIPLPDAGETALSIPLAWPVQATRL